MNFLQTTFDQSKSFAGQTPHLAKPTEQPSSKFASAMASLEKTAQTTPPLSKKEVMQTSPTNYVYTHTNKVDPPEDWQLEDIEQMYQSAITRGYCANWSEM